MHCLNLCFFSVQCQVRHWLAVVFISSPLIIINSIYAKYSRMRTRSQARKAKYETVMLPIRIFTLVVRELSKVRDNLN